MISAEDAQAMIQRMRADYDDLALDYELYARREAIWMRRLGPRGAPDVSAGLMAHYAARSARYRRLSEEL